jgi:predicted ATP-grasp superfamily ATP-dependent carboligase
MGEVETYQFKDHDLSGGTLVISVPHQGIGNILLTDFVLEDLDMDHTAALDSDAFPPLALMHTGKARFPVRIHADPATKVAVLRSEFAPPQFLVRPLTRAILTWATEHDLARVITLDAVFAPDNVPAEGRPRIVFTANRDETSDEAKGHGLAPFREGAIGGVPAMALLLAPVHGVDHLGLLAVLATAADDVHSASWFAQTLPHFVPPLHIDMDALDRKVHEIARTVTEIQEQVRAAVERMRSKERDTEAPPTSMYR